MKKNAMFTLFFLLSCANDAAPAPTEVIAAINEAINLKIPITIESFGNRRAMHFDLSQYNKYYSVQMEVKTDVLIFIEKRRVGHAEIVTIPLNQLKYLTMGTETKISYQGKFITSDEFDDLPEEQQKEISNNIDNGSSKTITEKTGLHLYFQ